MSHLIPTPIVDKNGKRTTVRRKNIDLQKPKRSLPKAGKDAVLRNGNISDSLRRKFLPDVDKRIRKQSTFDDVIAVYTAELGAPALLIQANVSSEGETEKRVISFFGDEIERVIELSVKDNKGRPELFNQDLSKFEPQELFFKYPNPDTMSLLITFNGIDNEGDPVHGAVTTTGRANLISSLIAESLKR